MKSRGILASEGPIRTSRRKGGRAQRNTRSPGSSTSLPNGYVTRSTVWPRSSSARMRWYSLNGVPRGSKNGSGAIIRMCMTTPAIVGNRMRNVKRLLAPSYGRISTCATISQFVSTDTFRLHYLAKAAAGIPRDLANSWVVSRFKAIRPTVLIYNCTFVCDARCEMCGNWKMADRKSDMTLEQLDSVMAHDFWGAIENLNISGGEPTTRNDLPEMAELFHRRLPRMRKIGINTTGLTPHRAIPMLTRIVKFCAEKDLLLSVRVSLDGVGDIHNQVRQVKAGFDKAVQTIEAMQALAKEHSNFQFGLAATIFATNLQD